VFTSAPLRWLGTNSYGIYMWHPFFEAPIFAFWRYFGKTSTFTIFQQFFFFSSEVIVSLGMAWLSYHLFGIHFLKLKRFFV